MSVQINQFLMWGISLPWEWHEKWEENNSKPDEFCDHFEDFMEDSAFTSNVKHKDGIFCLFDGCNGAFLIIGRVIEKSKNGELLADGNPLSIKYLTELEQELIRTSVERNFGANGEFKHWIVTQYR